MKIKRNASHKVVSGLESIFLTKSCGSEGKENALKPRAYAAWEIISLSKEFYGLLYIFYITFNSMLCMSFLHHKILET